MCIRDRYIFMKVAGGQGILFQMNPVKIASIIGIGIRVGGRLVADPFFTLRSQGVQFSSDLIQIFHKNPL